MSSIAKIVGENPHLAPIFGELTAEEKVQLDEYLAVPRMAEGFGTKNTKLGRALLESNKEKSLNSKLSHARTLIKAILTDKQFRNTITTWKSLMPENEPEPFNAAGSPVRVAKAPAAPPEIENRVPKYLMPKPEVRQRKPPQLNFNNNNNNKNEPNKKRSKSANKRKSKMNRRNKRKTRKN
jgi:hypothetical protein